MWNYVMVGIAILVFLANLIASFIIGQKDDPYNYRFRNPLCVWWERYRILVSTFIVGLIAGCLLMVNVDPKWFLPLILTGLPAVYGLSALSYKLGQRYFISDIR